MGVGDIARDLRHPTVVRMRRDPTWRQPRPGARVLLTEARIFPASEAMRPQSVQLTISVVLLDAEASFAIVCTSAYSQSLPATCLITRGKGRH